ncbi:MAG: amidohydrolase family protein [Candidatus Lokiarchaeota archaeon]|nr:amidohydrolase family protein [Candidatus Lokiarchaeota archaeon]
MANEFKIFDAHMHHAGRFKPREESLIQLMDKHGIEKAAVTTLNQAANMNAIEQSGKILDIKELLNQFVPKQQYDHEQVRALIKEYPKRIYGFFWFNPKIASEDDWDFLEKYIVDYGFKGVKTHPYIDFLKAPHDFYQLAEFCVEHDVPLYIHSGSGFFFQKQARVKDYHALAKKYKELKLIIGHAAFSMEYCVSLVRFFAHDSNIPNVYFETSVSIPFGILSLIKAMGEDRVIFGSDAPAANPPDIEINKIICLNLEKSTLQKVFYNNFAHLIKLN